MDFNRSEDGRGAAICKIQPEKMMTKGQTLAYLPKRS